MIKFDSIQSQKYQYGVSTDPLVAIYKRMILNQPEAQPGSLLLQRWVWSEAQLSKLWNGDLIADSSRPSFLKPAISPPLAVASNAEIVSAPLSAGSFGQFLIRRAIFTISRWEIARISSSSAICSCST